MVLVVPVWRRGEGCCGRRERMGEGGGLVSIGMSMNEWKRKATRQRGEVFYSMTNMKYD